MGCICDPCRRVRDSILDGDHPFVADAADVERGRGDDVRARAAKIDMRSDTDLGSDRHPRAIDVVPSSPRPRRCRWQQLVSCEQGRDIGHIHVDDDIAFGNYRADVRLGPHAPPAADLIGVGGRITEAVLGPRVLSR